MAGNDKSSRSKVSVVIPVTRPERIESCLRSIEGQRSKEGTEIILVSDNTFDTNRYNLKIKNVIVKDRNSAKRRNAGVENSEGSIIAFIDDDVTVTGDWLEKAIRFFEKHPQYDILGGPNVMPEDAPFSERISDALLKAPLIGSGVLSHMGCREDKVLNTPSDIALCNMLVRKELFNAVGGFNEKVGYICEDTEFLYNAIKKMERKAFYKYDLAVFHKRRPFPFQYLKQRFLYRVKNGKMLFAYPEIYMKNYKIALFLLGGIVFVSALFIARPLFWVMLALYFVLVGREAAKYVRESPALCSALFFAFPVHHAAYFAGMIAGIASGLLNFKKLRGLRRGIHA